MRSLALAVMLAMASGGCATSPGDYPSLALRDAERVTGSLAPATPPPIAPVPEPPSATLDRIDSLAGEARGAHRAFEQEAPAAHRAVDAARGHGAGTENWARAQVALAGLEASRSRAMIALADLDRLYVAAAIEGQAVTRMEAVIGEISTLIAAQNATLDALLGNLG